MYENAYGNGIDLKYTPIFSGVKEDIILPQYMQEASFSFLLETVGASLYRDSQGWYLAADAQAEPALRMGDTLVYDAIGKPCQGGLTVETVTPGSQYRVTVSAPDSFLSDPETVYPVTVDPSLRLTVSNTTHGAGAIEDSILFAGYPNYNYGAFLFDSIGLTQVNYGTARTVMKLTGFINSSEYRSLSANQITNVQFYVTEASGRPSQRIHLYPLTENTTWTESTVTWNNAGAFDTNWECYADVDDSQITPFDITALVKAWKNGTYNANAGFILINDDETAYKQIFASDHSAADYRPYVEMTYNPAVALSASEVAIVKNATCTLVATTSPAGLPVTWQSNNTSVATVNNGIVTAHRTGSAQITATCVDANGATYSASCNVYVIIPNGVYYIRNNYSGALLGVQNASIFNFSNVHTSTNYVANPTEVQSTSQMWKIYYLGSGYYSIRPLHKLDMGLDVTVQNVDVYKISANDSLNLPHYAKWTIEQGPTNTFIFKNNGEFSKTLQEDEFETTASINVIADSYAFYSEAHLWKLERISTPPTGIFLYDTNTGQAVTQPVIYVAPNEQRTLADASLTVSTCPDINLVNEISWSSNKPSIVAVNVYTGAVRGLSHDDAVVTGSLNFGNTTKQIHFSVHVTAVSNGVFCIRNGASAHYLDIENQQMANGTPVEIRSFNSLNSQKWQFEHQGNGYYTIRSANATGNYYLGVENDSSESNANIVLRTGTITDGMLWGVGISESGNHVIYAKCSEADEQVMGTNMVILNYSGENVNQIAYTNGMGHNDEWNILSTSEKMIYLEVLYDSLYIEQYNGSLTRINDYILALQEKYLYEFGIYIQDIAPRHYQSYLDICPSNNGDFCNCGPCANTEFGEEEIVHEFHHTNVFNAVDHVPLPDMNNKFVMAFTAHQLCHATNHNYFSVNGVAICDENRMLITDIRANSEDVLRTVIHEFGHLLGAEDHYAYDTPSTENKNTQYNTTLFSSDCIFGENKDNDEIVDDLTICAGCRMLLDRKISQIFAP